MAARKGPPKGPPKKSRKKGGPKLTVVGGGRPPEPPDPPEDPPEKTCPIVYVPGVDRPPPPPKKRGAPKEKRGRPFVCNGPVRRRLIENAYLGLYHKDVAAEAGVSTRALDRLIKQAKAALRKEELGRSLTEWDKELCRFWRAFRQAENGPKKALLSIVMGATDPKVALEVLGRRWSNEFGRRTQIGNAPDMDEDGQPTKAGTLRTSGEIDPTTKELLKAELAKRGAADRVLDDDDEGSEIADELPDA